MLLSLAVNQQADMARQGPFAATVTRAPGATGGRLDVALDADPVVVYEQVPWTPHPGPTFPPAGAAGLVVFDDRGDPWLIAWRGA